MSENTVPPAVLPNGMASNTEHSDALRWRPFAMSLLLHLFLLIGALLIISRFAEPGGGDEPDRAGQIVLAVVSEDSEVEYLDESDMPAEAIPEPATNVTDMANEPPPAIDLQPPPNLDLTGMLPVENPIDATGMANTDTASATNKPYELTAEDLKMIEADQKLLAARRPAGPPTTLSLFGSGALTGRKFVFLIDRSKSMGEQGLGVLREARAELTRAIGQLESHHQFQIIVYNNSTAAIGNRQLLKATDENKALVGEFLDSIAAYAGTNHQNGIYAALAFDPDVLVMITDGGSPELHDGQIAAISRAARGTQIHALQFGYGEAIHSDHFLKRLANSTSGAYRYVDVYAWRDRD